MFSIPPSSRLRSLLGRIGVSFVFLSFGTWEIIQPDYWTAFIPSFLAHVGTPALLVRMHGIVLSLLGLGILLEFYVWFFAFIGTLVMLEIVIGLWLDSGFTDIFVRDAGILLFTASLIFEGPHRSSS